jgi:hypothetical protein
LGKIVVCCAAYVRVQITQLPNFPIAQFKENELKLMANTASLSREERKKAKRASRKKRKAEHPLKPRDYARGSKKSKVKKMARGQSKRT